MPSENLISFTDTSISKDPFSLFLQGIRRLGKAFSSNWRPSPAQLFALPCVKCLPVNSKN